MNAKLLSLLAVCSLAWNVVGQTRVEAPDSPPKAWSVLITINVSKDLAQTFLDTKPNKNAFLRIREIDLWVRSDGGVTGPRKHPLLTGKLPSRNLAGLELPLGAIGYLPIVDQGSFYQKIAETVNSHNAVDESARQGYDAPEVEIGIRLGTNELDTSVPYYQFQTQDGLPKPLLEALALLRRNLPVEYAKLFDFLKVPRLPSLPANEANKYAKCVVHDEWLRVEEVPIRYGLPMPREKYWAAARELFPNARHSIMGGCMGSLAGPTSAKALYCETCRSAEKKWVNENEVPPTSRAGKRT